MPRETVEAFQDHGKVERTLDQRRRGRAPRRCEAFAEAGIDYDDVVQTLEREGVEKFAKSFRELFADLEAKRDQLVAASSGPSSGGSWGSSCAWTRSAPAPPPAPATPPRRCRRPT